MVKEILDKAQQSMDKAIAALHREMQKIRTGRASVSLLDSVRVDYYGTPTPLSQVATLTVPEARLITVQPWEKSLLPAIEKAIYKSDLGLTPSSDGELIRIGIPALTEERRKEMVKVVKVKSEDAKISIRSARREANEALKKLEKDKEREAKDGAVFAQNLKSQIKGLEDKLDTLLDAHLDGTITKEEYTAKKQKILNQKIEISEKLKDFEQNGNHWLEPAKKFILDSKQAEIIALQENLFEKKDFLKKIGSNRILRERELVFEPRGAWQILLKSGLNARRARAEALCAEATNAEHTIWLRILNEIRTFFRENPEQE